MLITCYCKIKRETKTCHVLSLWVKGYFYAPSSFLNVFSSSFIFSFKVRFIYYTLKLLRGGSEEEEKEKRGGKCYVQVSAWTHRSQKDVGVFGPKVTGG